ncbi:MAG: LuxR C-terminal-related transcriptional regulator [Chloroflexi bacterium]|nr:LuxR C-terminal-related transcriptional regulator [Chloroflexota bacterium]
MQENEQLSEREREILRLVATGASNKEIAQRLVISTNTVKVHLRNIFAKTGVASRTEATLYAIREGLAQVPGLPTAGEKATLPGLEVFPEKTGLKGRRLARYLFLSVPFLALLIFLGNWALSARKEPNEASASPVSPATSNRWQFRAPLPTARSSFAAAVSDNQIYVISGATKGGVTSVVERYDPTSNTWMTLAPKPTPVTDISAAVVGGQIYVPGGRLASEGVTDRLEVFDPQQNRWEQRASLPSPLCAYATVAFEGKIYVFGGWDGHNYVASVYEYDPGLDAWRSGTPMSIGRAYASASSVASRIYVVGGFDGKEALPVNEVYTPEREGTSNSPWNTSAPMPEARYAMGAASIGGAVYIIGGTGGKGTLLPPLEYVPNQDQWQSFKGQIPDNWSHLRVVSIDPMLYALGGDIHNAPSSQNVAYQAIYTILVPAIR